MLGNSEKIDMNILNNLTNEQRELAEMFKPLAMAETQQEKKVEFIKFMKYLESKKVAAQDPNSVVRPGEFENG